MSQIKGRKVPASVPDARLETEGERLREALVRQVTGAVRWVESMQVVLGRGPQTFVEVGPGKVLCGLLRQIDRGQVCVGVEDGAGVEKALESRA